MELLRGVRSGGCELNGNGPYQEIKMKPRYMREKTLWTAIAFVLACLVAPALLADEAKKSVPSTAGRSSSQATHSAPARSSTPSGGSHTPSSVGSRPSNRNPSAGSGGGTHTPNTNSNPGGGAGNRPGYNPGNRPGNTPSTNTAAPTGNHPGGTGNRPGYNPGNNPGNNTGNNPGNRVNNPGGNTGNRPGNNNPGVNTGNRTPGYNPGNNNNNGNRTPGYNPGNNNGNRNPGNYNPGNNNSNRNPGGNNNVGNRNNPGSNRPQFHPPAGAQSTARPDGSRVYSHNGASYHTDRNGHLASYSRPGTEARFGNNGRISSAHFTRPDHSNVYVNRGPRGERTVVAVRPGGTRIVSYGGRYGYSERVVVGRPGYVSRTYIYGGRPYVHVYHSYGWRGITYYRYVPPVYYHPAFYGWAWSPWRSPIVFGWGWRSDPWYGYYGGYFAPAPVYPTASLWLTDYLLAENLRLAYESRQASYQGQQPPPQQDYPQNTGSPTLTPEIKAAIAEEVRQQLEAERAAAQGGQQGQPGYNPTGGYQQQPQGQQGGYSSVSPTGGDAPPPALDPKQRIFVVSTNLDVQVAGGQGCALTPGDIILRTGDNVVGNNLIGVSVLSSKPGDCPVNSAAQIEVVQLQEMHNQFREHIGSGMKQLADNAGKNGLPPAPAANPRTVAEGQAPAEQASAVEQALLQTQNDANQAEQEVQQAANSAQ
jgi:hypothetical protein